MCSNRVDVLIVDDDAGPRMRLERACREIGLQALGVADAGAVETAMRSQPRLRGAIIEPNLPGSNWYQSLRRFASLFRGVPVVLVSAFWSTALCKEAESFGAVACLRKPVKASDVLTMLDLARPIGLASNPAASLNTDLLALVEWEHINNILLHCHGNMTRAARLLGIQRPTLYKKLRKHPPWPPSAAGPLSEGLSLGVAFRDIPR